MFDLLIMIGMCFIFISIACSLASISNSLDKIGSKLFDIYLAIKYRGDK